MKGEELWASGKIKLKPLVAKLRREVWMGMWRAEGKLGQLGHYDTFKTWPSFFDPPSNERWDLWPLPLNAGRLVTASTQRGWLRHPM